MRFELCFAILVMDIVCLYYVWGVDGEFSRRYGSQIAAPWRFCVIRYHKCQNFDVLKPVRFKDVWKPFQIRSDLLL